MRSPSPALTVITCPHCGTRYQVPMETLGARGREVSCAHCGKSWQALPGGMAPAAAVPDDDDRMFDADAERDLDASFAAEEQRLAAADSAPPADLMPSIDEIKAAMAARPVQPEPSPQPEAPPLDPKLKKTRDKAFARRQDSIAAKLPLARIRRVARATTLGLLLVLIAGGFVFRTEIVRSAPDLAGAYAALGLPVNILGLEFRAANTLLSLHGEATMMQVDAEIHSIASRTVTVPPVVVTLLDAAGVALYEWSVTPETRDLEPGEAVAFTTRLGAPPAAATRVRLTFSGGRAQSETPIATAIQPQEPAR